MRIGIPKEIKPNEGRVALTPGAVAQLVQDGHELLLQAGAGVPSGYRDDEYRRAGGRIVPDAAALYGEAELVLKVKEPQPAEYGLFRPEQLLFSFLHLPTTVPLARALCERGVTAVAFESLEEHGRMPLLAPMSDIAGRLAVQIGATLLHGYRGGRGLLLGGVEGAEAGTVVVLGAGVAGCSAARAAAALGARVIVCARRPERARELLPPERIAVEACESAAIERAVLEADLVIGALRVPSGIAPKLVSAATVRRMRPGSVIVDVCIDQGGCIETTRATSYDAPTYVRDGVVHFAVANMPGAVPRTASQALSAALLPYARRLAALGTRRLIEDDALARAVNVAGGRIVHPEVAASVAAS
ncbi:MAG TPA: alanine dehydrogenase [Burkholderiales bacterium]